METIEVVEDEYDPPPHALAQIWNGLVWLYRLVFRERTRWRYVGWAFFWALTDGFLAQRVFSYLPGRFHADARRMLWVTFDLMESARTDQGEFLQKVAWYGGYIVLLTPIEEEVLFRGLPILLARFAFSRVGPKAGKVVAASLAVVSTLLFAWMHNPIIGMMPVSHLFFGGVAWGLAWRWGLRYSVLFHLFVNGMVFSLTVERIMMITG